MRGHYPLRGQNKREDESVRRTRGRGEMEHTAVTTHIPAAGYWDLGGTEKNA